MAITFYKELIAHGTMKIQLDSLSMVNIGDIDFQAAATKFVRTELFPFYVCRLIGRIGKELQFIQ